MNRTPLPENYPLYMENGGEYIIKRKIAEGGFSLVYEAETPGGTAPVVIKEYFPAEGAFRNTQNKVVPLVGYEDSFLRNLNQFNSEGVAGGQVAKYTFQTVSFLSCGNGYALMQEESQDMVSISDLVASWSESPPIPYTGNLKDADPVFTDLTRLKYSLHIIESVLSVLSTIHKSGYLHLDISNRNVIWAGADQTTGRNCVAFIADYGCVVSLTNGIHQPSYQLSYSPGFAAPEIQKGLNQLAPATDIYSVGMLLFFLCIGNSALEISRNRKRQVVRELSYLKLPQRIRDCLVDILCTATADKDCRYQSAYVMQEEIRKLDEMIPIHPINPDNTCAFTLYSLKSMLEGSLGTHYSWAHELSDRRGISIVCPNWIWEPIASIPNGGYANELVFFDCIMPRYISRFFAKKIETNKAVSMTDILSCNYPQSWKNELSRIIIAYGSDELVDKCETLLFDANAFLKNKDLLFAILENDCILKRFYNRCNLGGDVHIGLAIIALYALLGDDYFKKMFGNDSSQCATFFGK